MAKKKSKAIISFKDFVFFVVYEREGGYGRHSKRQLIKSANSDLKVEHIKGGRPHRTEWYPITHPFKEGMASVKYTIYPTWNGLKQLIFNANIEKYEHNTMGILTGDDCYPAVSLDTGYQHGYGGYTSEEELKKRFKSDYHSDILNYQDCYHVNCYVSVYVPEQRLIEAIEAVFGKKYDDLTEDEHKKLKTQIDRYNDLCELMNDYIEKACEYPTETDIDESQFILDFRQLSIPFEKAL